jgi:hypothetical protein
MTVSSRCRIALASLPLILAVCGGAMSVFGVDPTTPAALDSDHNSLPVVFDSTVQTGETSVHDAYLRVPTFETDRVTRQPAKPALSEL